MEYGHNGSDFGRAPNGTVRRGNGKAPVLSELVRCLTVLVAMFVLQRCIPEIYAFEILSRTGLSTGDPAFQAMYSEHRAMIGIITDVVLVIFIIVRFISDDVPLCERFGKPVLSGGKCVSSVFIGLSLQALFTSLLVMIYMYFPSLESFSVSDSFDTLFGGGSFVSEVLLLAVITPITEEIVFRGIIFKSLEKIMPPAGAVIVSALVFGAAHMNLEQFFYAFPIGVVLSFIFYKSGSLWAPIIMHMSFNGGNYLLNLINADAGIVFLLIPASLGIFIITLTLTYFSKKE